MELIAASPHREGASAGARRAAVRRRASPRSCATCRRRAAGANSPLLVPRRRDRAGSARSCIAADRGLCGGVQLEVIRAAEGDMRARSRRRAARPRSSPSAARPRATSASATTRSTPRSAGSRDNPTYEDAREVAAAVVEPRSRRASSTSCSSSTRGSSRPAARKSSSCRCCRCEPPRKPTTRPMRDATPASRAADYEFEPDPDAILDDAAAALRRGAYLRRAAQRGGVGARGPPARDEGRDRQRRGPDPHVHAGS